MSRWSLKMSMLSIHLQKSLVVIFWNMGWSNTSKYVYHFVTNSKMLPCRYISINTAFRQIILLSEGSSRVWVLYLCDAREEDTVRWFSHCWQTHIGDLWLRLSPMHPDYERFACRECMLLELAILYEGKIATYRLGSTDWLALFLRKYNLNHRYILIQGWQSTCAWLVW